MQMMSHKPRNMCSGHKWFNFRNVKTWDRFVKYTKCTVCGCVLMATRMVKPRKKGTTGATLIYDKY